MLLVSLVQCTASMLTIHCNPQGFKGKEDLVRVYVEASAEFSADEVFLLALESINLMLCLLR
jgi:hypothetical protein